MADEQKPIPLRASQFMCSSVLVYVCVVCSPRVYAYKHQTRKLSNDLKNLNVLVYIHMVPNTKAYNM